MAKPMVSQLTYADLEALPEDGKRYELIDGELFVSPSPSPAHQDVVGNLHVLLRAACPPDLKVLLGPLDWLVDEHNVYVPDLMVVRRGDTTPRLLPRPPLLAIEVLSPSTRHVDLGRKRTAYARAGLDDYWIVDPLTPSVQLLERRDGRLHAVAAVSGFEPLTVDRPFRLTVVPADLLD
ncbi:MAG TPA: Uma2 family endonuclease [Acidimicrobiales bacterium]|nr:Uma2 family endonuclease [Acidimicrobiales bacterium]